TTHAQDLTQNILGCRCALWCSSEKSDQTCSCGLSCAFLEEFGRCFYNSNFLRNSGCDPLVQGYTIFFSQPRRCPFNGIRQFQRVSSFAHRLTFFSRSPGRITGIPNRSPADQKCATLYVTKPSAFPLIAASRTISSLGSRTWGRH